MAMLTCKNITRAFIDLWGRITSELCQKWIAHYYKGWGTAMTNSGTVAKCIKVDGARFSKPKLQIASADDE